MITWTTTVNIIAKIIVFYCNCWTMNTVALLFEKQVIWFNDNQKSRTKSQGFRLSDLIVLHI